MRSYGIPLVIGVIIFGTSLAGAASVAQLYSVKMAEKVEAQTASQKYEEPVEVTLAREHLDEQITFSESTIQNVDASDPYVANALNAVTYEKQRLLLPLPYELAEPAAGDARANTVVYRPAGETGELTAVQSATLLSVKKERLESFHNAMDELSRRSAHPSRNTTAEALLNTLADELPFETPPIVVGNACGGQNTLGCFYHSGEIEVTPAALAANGGMDECLLLSVIAHETRHYNQFASSGVGDYSLPELEADAEKFARDNLPARC